MNARPPPPPQAREGPGQPLGTQGTRSGNTTRSNNSGTTPVTTSHQTQHAATTIATTPPPPPPPPPPTHHQHPPRRKSLITVYKKLKALNLNQESPPHPCPATPHPAHPASAHRALLTGPTNSSPLPPPHNLIHRATHTMIPDHGGGGVGRGGVRGRRAFTRRIFTTQPPPPPQ
ncbi:hypothetical protein E2C01_046189 [Portunus trituberculatus]|uniref:Uncharacterized protein n=1 Tax=Portunus trituberculatus TaxID=210409 RepID=A0A5B7G6Y9_PORTR|nr:hypothetical protein [Portunus trituberculatus]